MEQRVSQLEGELLEARSFLEEKDRDLVMAAEFGKKLLETNQELQNRLDEITSEYSERVEVSHRETKPPKSLIFLHVHVHVV